MELSLITIIVVLLLVAVAFTYLGILVGRRSGDANRIADTIRSGDFEAFRNEMRREFAELQTKLRSKKTED